MIFFIIVLRALAAILITNSHYTGIYPTDLIANGGLLGDVIFFSVSGYCLYNTKNNFFKWYGKRVYRIYIPVIIITLFYLIIGSYSLDENYILWWFLYPTYYHFVASIIILYIPYYIIMKIDYLKKHIIHIMIIIALIWIGIYVLFYDKSYYHIDTVREPMIRFLFFEAMLLGALFRQKDDDVRNKFSIINLVGLIISLMAYFGTKMLFSKIESIAYFQIFNQFMLLVLLFFLFKFFASLDSKLEQLPNLIKQILTFIAKITLEIYLVQYVIIDFIRPLFSFPINWFVLTASIIIAAFALHLFCDFLYKLFKKIKIKIIGENIA